jgi:tellurite resistance protein TehA-like permease
MKLRWRLALALAGLVLVFSSLAVLAYVFWPLQPVKEQFRPAPTLFAPPLSLVIEEPLA